jgi:predicted ArsR family transcriptional regulator
LKKTWDDVLKPIEPLGENERTLAQAGAKMGLGDIAALRRMRELEKTGQVEYVGPRKLSNGHITKHAWRLL